VTFVENSGIARVKCVPVGRLEQAAGWGVGATPVFDVFAFDDNITTSPEVGGPDGDVRLLPDLDRLTPWPPSPAGHGRPPRVRPRPVRAVDGPQDPVGAADLSVLARQTIRALAYEHDLRVSFAPVAVAGAVGNGGHVHWSVWEGGRNLYAGGDGPYGMTAKGESFAAGVLSSLPALVAVGAPSVASYLRLVPSHWAGVFQSWGRETR
jgi:Glutamine synthetase, catalytic domain